MSEEQKKSYLEKMSEQLLKWDEQIDELKGKASQVKDSATDSVKDEYNKKIQELRDQKAKLSAKLQDLQKSGDEAWESIKTGVEHAAKDLKEAFSAAYAKFKE